MEIICSSKDYHFGEFYVRFDRSFFPNENWMDFYILILAEWIRVIKKVEYKNLIDFRLDWMEGLDYLLCTKNYDTVSIIGIYDNRATQLFGEIQFSEFKRIVYDVKEKILRDAKKELIWNEDLEALLAE